MHYCYKIILQNFYVYWAMKARHQEVSCKIPALCYNVGPDSSVGIATRYGLEGPGIEFRWGEIFRSRPDQP